MSGPTMNPIVDELNMLLEETRKDIQKIKSLIAKQTFDETNVSEDYYNDYATYILQLEGMLHNAKNVRDAYLEELKKIMTPSGSE